MLFPKQLATLISQMRTSVLFSIGMLKSTIESPSALHLFSTASSETAMFKKPIVYSEMQRFSLLY